MAGVFILATEHRSILLFPRQLRQLMVEDNLRLYMRLLLAPHYQLMKAFDGQQGLEIALDALLDLIVTDLIMPRFDGVDLCLALRADIKTDPIPLVVLTAKVIMEDQLNGFKAGADDYLAKPFLSDELLVRLQNLRHRQKANRAHWQRTLTIGATIANRALPLVTDLKITVPTGQELSVDSSTVFLNNLYTFLDKYLDQPDFEVEQLADLLSMSSRTLNRKLKALLGLSAREVIRSNRLQRATEFLRMGISPTNVAYRVGFGSLAAFSRAYKGQYGYPPNSEKG